jgi:alpha-ketoglutarate-dependent 2,4-dichlorophenoxyacetate dioxygenase
MALNIRPIGKEFAAEILGLNLGAGIGARETEGIEQAIAQYGVLVFRRQPLTDDQQQAFIQSFGPPANVELKELKNAKNAHPHMFDVATVDNEGLPIDPESSRGLYLRANLLWHTDGSQTQPPIRLTALSARTLPIKPPPTEYADMRGSYETLSPTMQKKIENMVVEHDIFYSRAKMGMDASKFTPEARKVRPPVQHPLVRKNSRTGRKSLYLASHASHVIGMPVEEGRELIEELTEHATQPQFVYAHDWEPEDLVMWDDSWTMHRSTPYSGTEPRVLRWSGVRELAAV